MMSDQSLILSSYEASRKPAESKEQVLAEFRKGMYSDEQPKPEQVTQQSQGFAEKLASAWELRNKNVGEIPVQAAGGALAAAQELGNTAIDLADWAETKAKEFGYGDGSIIPDDLRLDFADRLIPKGQTVAGGITRAAVQFVLPFAAVRKSVKAIGFAANAGKLAKLVEGAAAGAAVDFAAFDPHEERLSNFIQKQPELANPISGYLAADPEDSGAKARFKQALEGAGLGVLTDGVMMAVDGYKALRRVKVGDAVEKSVEQSAAKAVEPPPFKGPQQEEMKPVAGKFLEAVEGAKPEERVFNVKLNNLKTTDDVKKAMTALSEQPVIKAEVGAARERIVQKDAELFSEVSGETIDSVMNRVKNGALNEKQLVGGRKLLIAAGDNLIEKAKLASGSAATDAARAEFLDAMTAYRAVQMQVTGAVAEAGRALRSLSLGVSSPSVAVRDRMIKEVLQLHGGSGQVDKMAAQLVEAASNGAKLVDVVKPGRWEKLSDGITSVYINGLLSTPSTHVANFLSNSLAVGNVLAERAIGESIGRLRSPGDKVVAGETKAAVEGLFSMLVDSFRLAGYAIKTRKLGLIREQASEKFFVNNLTGWFNKADFGAAATAADTTTTIGKGVELLGNGVRIPSALLGTSDDFFKTLNYRMQLRAMAVRDAASKGLDGKAATEYAANLIKNPTDELHLAAVDFARENTFTKPLEGWTKALDQTIRQNPVLRVISPFVRTPLNIFEYALERNPVLAGASSRVRADISAGGARRDNAIAKLALGGTTMAVVGGLAANGMITGSGPVDVNARKLKELGGWRPNSIKIGDTWYSYKRTDPFGMVLGMAADMAELGGTLHDSAPDDHQQLAIASMALIAQNLTPDFLAENVGELLEVANGDQRTLKKFVTRLGSSLMQPAFSGFLRAITKEVDGTKRDTAPSPDGGVWEEMVNQVKARTPGFSTSLPPQMNIFGEPVVFDPGVGPDIVSPIAYSQKVNDPVIQEMVKLQLASPVLREPLRPGETDIRITMPPRHIVFSGVPMELNPKEYGEFVKLSAGIGLPGATKTLHEQLESVIESGPYQAASNQIKRAQIMKVVQKYRSAGLKQLLGTSESLQEKLISYKNTQAQVLMEESQ